jgi:hypothetical protein
MPQLALQHSCPAGHTTEPHLPGSGSNWQSCCVQVPSSGAQIPQLELQQYSSALQTLGPQGSSSGRQNRCVHVSPSRTHTPQLSLQQISFGPQTLSPQGTCPGAHSSRHGMRMQGSPSSHVGHSQ